MPLMGELVDDFCAPTLNDTLWNAVNSAGNSGFQAGCRYTFIVNAGATGDATLTSDIAYDLTDSHVHVELIDAGVQEAGLETYPLILTQAAANQDDAIFVVVSNGLVGIYESVGGVPSGKAFPAYNAVSMRWWEITEEAGVVYVNSAPDVRGPWTTQASWVPTIAITSLFVKIRTFDFLSLATAKQVSVSNLNYLAPPDVPFPNGALPVGMEIAFGADINAAQSTWDWIDVTPPAITGEGYFMKQEVTTTRGRQDEFADVAPTQADIDLDNPWGDFTPDNPNSIYYPNVDVGTPGRWWINAGLPRLYLKPVYGSRATVSSISSLDLTSDLDVRMDLHLRSTHPGGHNAVLAGRARNGGPYSWRLEVKPSRLIELFWSNNGVTGTTLISAAEVLPSSARATLRVTLDVDNGGGNHEAKFYVGYEGVNGTFTQMGPTVTGTGVTSIANAAADLIIGSPPEIAGLFALDASVYRFQLRNGINGPVIVDADLTDQVSGVPQFVDSTGLKWTVSSLAELSNRWFRTVGTIDSWAPVWPWGDLSNQVPGGIDEGQARVELELAGILRRLGQGAAPLQSPLRRATQVKSALRAYWPMEDEKTATQFASALTGGTPMVFGGAVTLATQDTLPGSKPLPVLTGTSAWSGAVVGTFSGAWRIDWYVYIPSTTPNQVFFMQATGDLTATVKTWRVDTSAGNVGVAGYDATGTLITSGAAIGVEFFDRWVNVQLNATQSGSNIAWRLAWFPVRYPFGVSYSFSGTVAGAVGGITNVAFPADADAADISTGHWAVLDEGGTSFPSNAANGWEGDTAAQRLIRLTDEEGIQLRLVGDPSLTARMGVQQIATLLTLLDDAKDADGGILFEQPDAIGLIYRTRASMYNQPPNMILDAHLNQLQNPFAPVLDDQRIRNFVTVQRRDGSSYEVDDDASIAKNGTYDTSVTLNLFQDSQLQDAAGWLLHQGTVQGMRYPKFTTNLGVAPEIIDAWLTCDQGAQVWATSLPPQHPNADVKAILEGYAEPISPWTWKPVINASPASVWDVAQLYGDWVDDQYLLRLETDGTILTFAVDADDTSLIVSITDGPYWVTGAAEFPFDIEVLGEQITVTGIGAPTGGTEFTGAGNADDTTPTTSFVAPSVVAPASGDLLIAMWCSYEDLGTYTLPGGMFIAALTDGTYTSAEDATEVLGAGGATGTRTATFSDSDTYSAISVVAHSALGTPGVQEFLNDVETDASGNVLPITLTTILTVNEGDWLLAVQAWDWDPGNNMTGPTGTGWEPVADSILANGSTSRVRAFAKRVTSTGIQSVYYPAVGGINDNHARLYVLTGVTGITQTFGVIRSINGVVRSHAKGESVQLWYQPVLAR